MKRDVLIHEPGDLIYLLASDGSVHIYEAKAEGSLAKAEPRPRRAKHNLATGGRDE